MSEVKMSKCKYLYVRNDWKKRDITIVSDLVDKEDKTFVRCGWAFRCNHDKFIKSEGRKIAYDRMECLDSDYSAEFEIAKDDIAFYKIASEVLSIIANKESTPKKYIQDIAEDLQYFIHCANGLNPKNRWDNFFDER
jgi:hypothetical protein